jgi:hypothetical protein
MTATLATPTARARAVSAGSPGPKFRIGLRHLDGPVVGVLRETVNPKLDWAGQCLFLDVPAGHQVRNHIGEPGWLLAYVEVLDPSVQTREEHLSAIDTAADEWLSAQEAWQSATASDAEWLLGKAREAYEAFIAAVGAPFEVTGR